MRHSRINKSTRHKKLKAVNELSDFNYVTDRQMQTTREQAIPKKLAQIMEFKAKEKQAAKRPSDNVGSTKRNAKLKKKYNALTVKTGIQTTIEKGMTRLPKPIPETVEKSILESDYQFLNRLNRMVAKSIAEANLEEHFDVDLGGKVKQDPAAADSALISPEESEKMEKRRNKRRLKDAKRKEKRQKAKSKLLKLKESQEFAFKKDNIQFGERVHQPPALAFGKKSKVNTGVANSKVKLNNNK